MKLSPNSRKLSFAIHISSSVSWLGAVIVFFVLAIGAINSSIPMEVRALVISLRICTLYVILPLAVLSFLSGFVLAVTSSWGLFKYYWIVAKFALTLVSTLLLVLHLQPIIDLSTSALNEDVNPADLCEALPSLILKSAAASVVLIFCVIISIFKPWGKINAHRNDMNTKKKSPSFYILMVLVAIIVIVVLKHLLVDDFPMH